MSKKEGKGQNFVPLGFKSYLKTHLLVWSRLLNDVTGGGCFLGKKSDLKMKS